LDLAILEPLLPIEPHTTIATATTKPLSGDLLLQIISGDLIATTLALGTALLFLELAEQFGFGFGKSLGPTQCTTTPVPTLATIAIDNGYQWTEQGLMEVKASAI